MSNRFVFLFLLLISILVNIPADEVLPELQVKRKNIFEFTKEPVLTKSGDTITIEFSVKDFCDATVAIQNAEGDIVRHLASGVLGEKAPSPFIKNSLDQKLIWDSKDDRGKYIDDLKNISVRVSLGLKPMYEKDLYTTPYKRISATPAITCGPEGFYVFEGVGRDHLMQFSQTGEYIKTIYPFPASKIDKVKGLTWWSYGNREKIPLKNSDYHQTLLSSGDNGFNGTGYFEIMGGKGATTIAIQGKRMVLAFEKINRITTDGSTGEFNLLGPKIGLDRHARGYGGWGGGLKKIGPASSAFSPDGKTVYFTGMMWNFDAYSSGEAPTAGSLQCVMKMNYESDDPVQVFVGKNGTEDYGKGPDQLCNPSSLDTDTKGNVYVTDYWNDRVQIFDPDGKLLQSISTTRPAKVVVHKITNEIYVFSFGLNGITAKLQLETKYNPAAVEKNLSIFSPFPEGKLVLKESFPLDRVATASQIALDSWSKAPAIWLAQTRREQTQMDIAWAGRGNNAGFTSHLEGIIKLEKIDGKWQRTDNFGERAAKKIVRPKPPTWNIQQLYFNPKSKKLYVGEADSGPTTKAFNELIEIDVESGSSKIVPLPFNPMDIAFDIDGLIYMRTMAVLARFNPENWKEIPFDYGVERDKVGDDGSQGGKQCPIVSGLMLPATNAVCYHQGGMDVNANGDILVACHNRTTMSGNKVAGAQGVMKNYTEYKPANYPGRLISSTSVCLHIWDKQGKVKMEDVVPGCPQTDGVFMDINNNVYIMTTPARSINGKTLDDGMSSTLFKFKAKKGTFLTNANAEIPLPQEQAPKKPQEVRGLWALENEWIYGGVGFAGFNSSLSGGCACWFSRFKLDYFARSIAPEPMQFSVAVLDSNGNLITRIGRYGNLDSAGPNSKEPLGGDEVGLFHPCFVTTHTDKRIFIADIGNERIVSVKLGYYTEKVVPITK